MTIREKQPMQGILDGTTIRNLPIPCTVTVEGESYDVDDGDAGTDLRTARGLLRDRHGGPVPHASLHGRRMKITHKSKDAVAAGRARVTRKTRAMVEEFVVAFVADHAKDAFVPDARSESLCRALLDLQGKVEMPIRNSVSVTAGSTVVDGYLTQFVAAPGDTFILNGLSFVVERQESSARMILADPWPGEELTDQPLGTGPHLAVLAEHGHGQQQDHGSHPAARGGCSVQAGCCRHIGGSRGLRRAGERVHVSPRPTGPSSCSTSSDPAADGDWTPGQALRGKDAAGVEFRLDT